MYVNQGKLSLKLPLLLTASVSTHGMVGAAFSDETRESMYCASLKWYLENLDSNIPLIFAENSGWDLTRLQTKLGAGASRVEWISVDASLCDVSRGKGYNEIILMNEAIRQSQTIRSAGAFMKVTGRYPIYNVGSFLRWAEKFFARGGLYYGDMKDHKIFDLLRTGWNGHAAYTVLFASTLEFYSRYLAETYQCCNDYTDNLIENVWYRVFRPFRQKKLWAKVNLRFPREPVCGGLQGSNLMSVSFNANNDSFRAKVQRFVGNCFRIFTPWFWF